jgi:thiosulfate dehydrogenase
MTMPSSKLKFVILLISVTVAIGIGYSFTFRPKLEPAPKSVAVKDLIIPEMERIPAGPDGELIRRGKQLLENTHELLPRNVGAKMKCTSCHLNSGTTANAGPWVGITVRFPQYRARSGKVDTLTDRVNDCFERSLNGRALAPDSPEMTAILAYMGWLSQGYSPGDDVKGSGMPKLKLAEAPDLGNGQKVYEAKCAVCHQTGGAGMFAGKTIVFPPLWGDESFNIGAGMARLHTIAGFTKLNMPLGQGRTLTDKEAWDVAAYVSRQPRPDFAEKHRDWPKGDKPKDARY